MNEPRTTEVAEREGEPTPHPADGARFADEYWDDAFCAWLDPTMRTCCG